MNSPLPLFAVLQCEFDLLITPLSVKLEQHIWKRRCCSSTCQFFLVVYKFQGKTFGPASWYWSLLIMPGYAKDETHYMHYTVICVQQSIFQMYFAVEQEMCESFPKNVMAGCLNICTTQRYFEHWLCDVQQITCAYSSTQIFTHSRTFITYKLTYQSTRASLGTLSVCFWVFI